MPKPDPYLTIERTAEAVAKRFGFESAPIDPFEIARKEGILVQQSPSLQSCTGALIMDNGAFAILYASHLDNRGFERFTVAHELGHYFLDGHPEKLFPDGGGKHLSKADTYSVDRYEREADHFACGLLMPEFLFRPAVDRRPQGLEGVKQLANDFEASLTATAIRFARFNHDAVAVVVCSKMKVDFCVMSPTLLEVRGLEWIERGSLAPLGTETRAFWDRPQFVGNGSTREGYASLATWFDGAPNVDVLEDVQGLGQYGRSLTILHCTDALPGV